MESRGRLLRFESLEDRRVLAVFTVTNLNDLFVDSAGDAPGTLRQAIFDANQNPDPDTIQFQPGLNGAILLNFGELAIASPIAINGPGAALLTINGQNTSRVLNIDDLGGGFLNVSISGLTLTGGSAPNGGGVFSKERLTIEDSVVTGNSADMGGGIYSTPLAELTVLHSSVSGNTASVSGGGIYNYGGIATITESTISGNSAVDGGGIRNGAGGSLLVARSTISGNKAIGGSGAFNAGGGILNSGGPATIASSTLSGNEARYGGGLYVITSLAVTTIVSNSTISDNVAMLGGGGIYNFVGRTVIEFSTITDNQAAANEGSGVASWGDLGTSLTEVYSSIIAANVSTDVDTVGGDFSTFVSNDYNMIGTGTGVPSFNQPNDDQVSSVELALGPLANNGGPTQTHLPQGGSRALNAGEPSLTAGSGGVPEFDQRGTSFTRVVGLRIDVGAVESQIALADLIGDYNGDLTVNAADYTVWRNTLGNAVAPYAGADGNGNGIIDSADHAVWKSRYGDSLSGTGTGAGDNVMQPEATSSLAQASTSPTTLDVVVSSQPEQTFPLNSLSSSVSAGIALPTPSINRHAGPSSQTALPPRGGQTLEGQRDEALLAWLDDGAQSVAIGSTSALVEADAIDAALESPPDAWAGFGELESAWDSAGFDIDWQARS